MNHIPGGRAGRAEPPLGITGIWGCNVRTCCLSSGLQPLLLQTGFLQPETTCQLVQSHIFKLSRPRSLGFPLLLQLSGPSESSARLGFSGSRALPLAQTLWPGSVMQDDWQPLFHVATGESWGWPPAPHLPHTWCRGFRAHSCYCTRGPHGSVLPLPTART